MDGIMRKLPIGIQTFEKLREGGYLYVDKTAFIWKIASTETPYFLSVPVVSGKVFSFPLLKHILKARRNCLKDL